MKHLFLTLLLLTLVTSCNNSPDKNIKIETKQFNDTITSLRSEILNLKPELKISKDKTNILFRERYF